MTSSPFRPPSLEFEVVGVATAAALVSGGLSVIAPYLIGLPGTLAALAVAACLARLRRAAGAAPLRFPRGAWAAFTALGTGGAFYLLAPGVLGSFRGLVLAVTLLPLWNFARRSPGGSL